MELELHYWVLDGRGVREATISEWAHQLNAKGNLVCQTKVGESKVSTVCLGFDHGSGFGPPILFETMVFPDDSGFAETHRYATYDQALAGHMAVVYRLRNAEDPS